MNELIKVNYENVDRPTVSGRELWEALEVGTPYNWWSVCVCFPPFELRTKMSVTT